ncbi:hypothetical protein [Hyphomicrobium sp.]|uniref:hypothetical protein n=1 Tax=Hyphomicrobium sp. TaxID=82 RepID=UPI002FDE8031
MMILAERPPWGAVFASLAELLLRQNKWTRRSTISNAHNVLTKKIFLMLDFTEQPLKHVAGIKNAHGSAFRINDRDVQDAFFLYQTMPDAIDRSGDSTRRPAS